MNEDYACYQMKSVDRSVSTFFFTAIEHVKVSSRIWDIIVKLKQRDAYWIHTLETLDFKGMNNEFSPTSFL